LLEDLAKDDFFKSSKLIEFFERDIVGIVNGIKISMCDMKYQDSSAHNVDEAKIVFNKYPELRNLMIREPIH